MDIKMNKILLSLMLVFLLVAPINAESIGVFKVNKTFEITNYCFNADCTYMNLSSITTPLGQIINLNAEMTQNIQNFNYSYTPNQLGDYSFITCADPNGIYRCEKDEFTINTNGRSFSAVQISIYIFFLLVCLLLIYLNFLLIIKNPLAKDEISDYKRYKIKKRNNFLYYMGLLKKKLWIAGTFGVYLSSVLFLVILNKVFYELGLIEISNLLVNINQVLLWCLIPFTLFWLGYIILYFYKITENIMRYQFGKLGEKR